MIQIILSNKIYENDVYPLVQSFFPQEAIKVFSQEEMYLKDQDITETNTKDMSELAIRQLKIDFREEDFTITITPCKGEEIIRSAETVSVIVEKAKYKNAMKRELYLALSYLTHKKLPWGILTGIRPTKLVYCMLEEGMDPFSIEQYMKEEYLCGEEKARMSYQIAKREQEILKEMDYRNGYSLYIGIPFCPSTCLYCSFPSYSIQRFQGHVEDYLSALEKEIRYGATCFPNKKLTTVYFGGGTPTTLTAKQLNDLLGTVKKYFDFTNVREFCVEAGRPDSITKDKLEVLKKWGVDRISINPQTMHQKTLDLIGRKHSIEQVVEAFQLARETGHDNINMDLIIGLPGENLEDVKETLTSIGELNPDSLTVHTLAVKRAARLNTEKENYENLRATDVPEMLEATIQFALDNDYLPYYLYRQKNMADNLENIGYARYGKEGLYNILIMEEQQTILALGAGAMSKFVFHEENRIERVDNVKSVTDYISRIDEMIDRKKEFLAQNKL